MKPLHLAIIIGAGIVFAIAITVILFPVFINKQDVLRFTNNPFVNVENNCGRFHTIPISHDIFTTPVLLMDSNSTSCVKLSFSVVSRLNPASYEDYLAVVRQELNFNIGDYNVTSDDHSFSITPGKFYTYLFDIKLLSQTVDSFPENYHIGDNPVNFPIGTNFTDTYLIRPLPNSEGFYDFSIPKPGCGFYPLAVGYASDQVNASDFSKVSPLGQTCQRSPYEITSVQVSDMDYKEIKLQTIPFK